MCLKNQASKWVVTSHVAYTLVWVIVNSFTLAHARLPLKLPNLPLLSSCSCSFRLLSIVLFSLVNPRVRSGLSFLPCQDPRLTFQSCRTCSTTLLHSLSFSRSTRYLSICLAGRSALLLSYPCRVLREVHTSHFDSSSCRIRYPTLPSDRHPCLLIHSTAPTFCLFFTHLLKLATLYFSCMRVNRRVIGDGISGRNHRPPYEAYGFFLRLVSGSRLN